MHKQRESKGQRVACTNMWSKCGKAKRILEHLRTLTCHTHRVHAAPSNLRSCRSYRRSSPRQSWLSHTILASCLQHQPSELGLLPLSHHSAPPPSPSHPGGVNHSWTHWNSGVRFSCDTNEWPEWPNLNINMSRSLKRLRLGKNM